MWYVTPLAYVASVAGGRSRPGVMETRRHESVKRRIMVRAMVPCDVAEIPDSRARRLRRIADKNVIVGMFLGFFLPPLAYVYIGRYRLAIINLLTVNYLLLGFIVVPLQTRSAIKNARRELTAAGIPRP